MWSAMYVYDKLAEDRTREQRSAFRWNNLDLSDDKALREKIIAFNPGGEELFPEEWKVNKLPND